MESGGVDDKDPFFVEIRERRMRDEIAAKDASIAELEQALVHSVYVIQQWHNLQLPERDRSVMWDIYWKNAPEMKQIRTALGKSEGNSNG